jgi:hypothetical protein
MYTVWWYSHEEHVKSMRVANGTKAGIPTFYKGSERQGTRSVTDARTQYYGLSLRSGRLLPS